MSASASGPVPERRVFFALWPGASQRARLEKIIRPELDRIRGNAGLRANWHLTVVFIGNVAAETVGDLLAASAQIAVEPFELRLDRLSYWRRPRIACLEASRTPAALARLVEEINEAVEHLGLAAEKRRYRPHLTIARKARSFRSRPLAQPLDLRWQHFELLESRASAEGVRYRPVKQ